MRNTSTNRRPEKWFRAGLWLVSVIFASFLIGLGGELVEQLPKGKSVPKLEHYTDQTRYQPLVEQKKQLEQTRREIHRALDVAELQYEEKANAAQTEQQNLSAWQSTRLATENDAQNPEVLKRTKAVQALNDQAREAQKAVEKWEAEKLGNAQQLEDVEQQMEALKEPARQLQAEAYRAVELETFLYRLALTLPLLIVAGYLFARQRQSRWWPFVWGFIFFALFAFFIELVPYLPSYGGYVRYIVGIVLTVLIGRYAIGALTRYLERKKSEENQPITERQAQLSYDQAQFHLLKSTCPSCERLLNFQDSAMDFCPHCGINLFHACHHCHTRKSAFSRYCSRCGEAEIQANKKPE